jgi:helicase
MKISDLPVAEELKALFAEQGIDTLYPPQELAVKPVLAGKNVVVAVPTASGKSLIAYIAISNGFIAGKKSIYIVPLRALASEKYDDLKMLEKLGAKVGLSIGDYDASDEKLEKMDVVVMTAEKADALMRHGNRLMDEAGIVVADEVHLLADEERGPTMEILLTNFKRRKDVQIIALSATVKNSEELAAWLNAEHISMDWRPVVLKEGVFCSNMIFYRDGTHREINAGGEPIVELVCECIRNGGQSLVFTNTRKSSETLARNLGRIVKKQIDEKTAEILAEIAEQIRNADTECTSAHENLAYCVRLGCAYHNASLTNNTRRIIEQNFRKGHIKCIVATPTLAAGINLPARRVIVRDVWRYSEHGHTDLPVMEVKQMCGRAGRPKYDREGEALLIAKNPEHLDELFEKYINGDVEDIVSNLASRNALRHHVLALIATGRVHDMDELRTFMGHTFLAHQGNAHYLDSALADVIRFLINEEFIVLANDTLKPTNLGLRTSDLYIDPLSAVIFRNSMMKKRELTNVGVFHAIALAPDMEPLMPRKKDVYLIEDFYEEWKQFLLIDENEGIEPAYFYAGLKTAAFLHDWVNEVPEDAIIKKYDIGPGDIRNRIELAEWLLYGYRELTKLFMPAWFRPLDNLLVQVKYGIKPELLPLIELPDIGRVRARRLYQRGIKSIEDIRMADPGMLASIDGIGTKLAQKLKEHAGDVRREEKEEVRKKDVDLYSF